MAMYQSIIEGNMDGQTVDVIMGWQNAAADNATDAASLANAIFTSWGVHMCPLLSSQYTNTAVTVHGVLDPTVTATHTGSTAGGASATLMPAFVVARVRLSTGLRGRSYQGRWGIPAVDEAWVDNTNTNTLTTTAQGTLQSAVDSFYLGVTPGFVVANAVISRIHNGAPRPTPISTAVVSHTVEQTLGSRVSRRA